MPDTSPTPVDPVIGKGQFEHPTQEALGRVAELRSRASIGPDSERIREVEAEEIIASYLDPHSKYLAEGIVEALRDAGLLPGPDNIVVSRETAKRAQRAAFRACYFGTADELRAALSQPHPEEQTP